MSNKVVRERARAAKRARLIRFDLAADKRRVLAYVCSRGHKHATFMHALACEGRR